MKTAVHFSSKTVEAPTPLWFFDQLDAEFHFTLDPCSTHENAKCRHHFTRAEDGLSRSWGRHRVFMNPPYGKEIARWMAKASLRRLETQRSVPLGDRHFPTL